MWRALFYKEWIKTRRVVAIILFILAGAVIYTFINTGQQFRASGAVMVWNGVVTKDASLVPPIVQWLPFVLGIALGAAQFIPEMTDKRFKLTLHLPAREDGILTALLAYGVAVLTTAFAVAYVFLLAGFSSYYPSGILTGMLLKTLPWFLAGLCSYLLTGWVCLERVWKRKIMYGVAGACCCYFFMLDGQSGSYVPMLPWLAVFTVVCFAFPFYSASRFKDGIQ